MEDILQEYISPKSKGSQRRLNRPRSYVIFWECTPQHLHAPVVPPRAKNDQIPPALNDLIVRLLSKDPQDRPASAVEVLQTLEQPDFLEADFDPAGKLSVLERIERGRLVGRERELQEAKALWNETLSGQGQMLLIRGEPGIGKTRLMHELVTRAEVSGGRALVGISYAEGGMPYAAFRQTIREVLRNPSDNGIMLPEFVLADLLALAPELCSRYPDAPTNPSLDPQAEQQRLFENLAIFYTMLSDQTPLLLVLEDAHWADSGTLSLLRHLARHTHQQQMMIVVTYREVELDEVRPFHEVLLDLNRERLATDLKLARLDRVQTGEMLTVLFAEGVTPEFLDGIYRETEGNPFFIEEVCKTLVESGKLYYADGEWHRPAMEELGIPQSVRVTIQSRMKVLPADAQELLLLAAILGREFEFDILTQVSELDEDTLIDGLESAERAQLIEKVSTEGGGTFAFVHALIPSTLVEGLRTLQRRRLHRRAATAIEIQRADDWESLAYHYTQAGKAEKAIKYLLQVGDRARGLYTHQEAIDNYHQALEFLKEQEKYEQAARTLMKLGLTYHTAFDFRRARHAYEEGFGLWQRAGRMEPTTPPPPAPHAFRFAGQSEPLTLDPGLAWEAASCNVIDQLFSGLVESSPEISVMPGVAHSWEVLDGGSQYIFHLRDDVRWSDGTPVTAKDFEYAWRRVLDPATGSPNANQLYDIKGARTFHQGKVEDLGVQALDETTLVVKLEGPTGYFLHLLAFNVAYPVPRHAVEALGEAWAEAENIVINGPFRLDEWKPGKLLVLVRNPDYHGRFKGNLQRVEQFLNIEGDARLEIYEANELDIAGLSPAKMDRARQRHAGEYISAPSLQTLYLGFDTSRPPFDDPRVRRAIAFALDKETLADVVLRGYVSPGTGGFVPPGMPGHSAGIGLPYDPEQARQLLVKAGYPGGRGFPGVSLLAQPDGPQVTQEFLQAQWQENLGIEIVWEMVDDHRTLLDRLDRELPCIYLHGWVADYPDPDNFLRVCSMRLETRWRNETYEQLVEKARRVMDQAERMRMYQQADKILIKEAPIIPLFHTRLSPLVKPWVSNFPIPAIGGWFLKDIIIEPH
ncbi:MAG: AAA family ATPase [Chloroflexi bacterium]|nr:AAA family ATPase [Chloroflexota bacterium]